MLASLMAVHKLAAAYLPIDIQMPPASIEVLIRDANPDAIMTQRSLAHLVPSLRTPCLFVDKNIESSNVAQREQVQDVYKRQPHTWSEATVAGLNRPNYKHAFAHAFRRAARRVNKLSSSRTS